MGTFEKNCFVFSSLEQGFLRGPVGKESACSVGDTGDAGWVPGQEEPMEEEMKTHFSIPTGKIPWTKEPSGLQSKGSKRGGHN